MFGCPGHLNLTSFSRTQHQLFQIYGSKNSQENQGAGANYTYSGDDHVTGDSFITGMLKALSFVTTSRFIRAGRGGGGEREREREREGEREREKRERDREREFVWFLNVNN